ncbi:hypothetical protein CFC21_025495 [Triticum aestivum]|uniref:Peroxidase n=3 Tax=Triticum TaxID=4564 RepID=A0A9R1Q0S3_TRITD|nr:peroxidase 64-like [Triticum dicoccoides]XP_044320572.1 peroxidase 64-like [Triticum aestivum]KAF7011160.1 hypothetical protein CFC21_025495 [Triticum aestivum]VAH52074.1 unnamed protein product [Triticum turgidum subsp. durum]
MAPQLHPDRCRTWAWPWPRAPLGSVLLALAIVSLGGGGGDALSLDHYRQSCPRAEAAVAAAVRQAVAKDRTVPAGLLRLHFHDCFVRGCDASVLIDSTATNTAEKDGPPNASLHAFFVIDNAKQAVEAMCPGVVSCADILALAARDAVALSGGPSWSPLLGRGDGRVSLASDTTSALPGPGASFDQLRQAFHALGMSVKDLVVLSGGHTLGFAHCSSFQSRIHGFRPGADVDPALNPSFAAALRRACPANNTARGAGSGMDPTSATFDNAYYRMLQSGRGLLSSDEVLLTHPKTRRFVALYAARQDAFFRAFVSSMLRMSALNQPGEVRANCRRHN